MLGRVLPLGIEHTDLRKSDHFRNEEALSEVWRRMEMKLRSLKQWGTMGLGHQKDLQEQERKRGKHRVVSRWELGQTFCDIRSSFVLSGSFFFVLFWVKWLKSDLGCDTLHTTPLQQDTFRFSRTSCLLLLYYHSHHHHHYLHHGFYLASCLNLLEHPLKRFNNRTNLSEWIN